MASMPIAGVTRAPRVASRPSPPPPPPPPLPEGVIDHGNRYTLIQHVHCLALITKKLWPADIKRKTGVKPRSQRAIKKKAQDRGYNPDEDPRILESYVVDDIRSGRPRAISKGKEEALLSMVRLNRAGREKSSEVLAYELGISYSSVLRMLHKEGVTNVKPTTKPGLTVAMRMIRLKWALAHQHWTLEDWKNAG
jgi:Transposase